MGNQLTVILDTHVLVWWTLDPGQLSPQARRLCDDIPEHGAGISTISIWAIGIKLERGNLEIGIGLLDYVRRLEA